MIRDDSRERVVEDVRGAHLFPLWMYASGRPPVPTPRAVAHLWSYHEVREYLLRCGALIGATEATRRVLMMINPALEPPNVTDTMNAGYQLILPNECAPAHRHSEVAVRFIIEGSGAFTTVNSERIPMEAGDLVITPTLTFHDHGHNGEGPMIWVDVLDAPLFGFLPVGFRENWSAPRFPSVDAGLPSTYRYPWTEMRARLDAHGAPFASCRYTRGGGGSVTAPLGARAERLSAGATSPWQRTTASHVYIVSAGAGTTTIGDATLQWERGDAYCIPAWTWYRHAAEEQSYLFAVDDRPMLEKLDLYREAESRP